MATTSTGRRDIGYKNDGVARNQYGGQVTHETNGYAWGRGTGGSSNTSNGWAPASWTIKDSKSNATPTASKSSSTKKTSSSTALSAASSTPTVATSSGGSSWSPSDVYAQYLSGIRQAAQDSYNRKMATIEASYNAARDNLQSNLDSTLGQLQSSYNRSSQKINANGDDSLRQAYVNSMLQKRNLRQQLAAQGLNGGASETTNASLANRYSNDRNSIKNQMNDNLSDLEYTYNNNVANAQQAFNSQVNNLELQKMQLENAAQDALANYQTQYSDQMAYIAPSTEAYLQALQGYSDAMNNYQFTPTEAMAQLLGINTTQADSSGNSTGAGRYDALQQYQQNGTQLNNTNAILKQQSVAAALRSLLGVN